MSPHPSRDTFYDTKDQQIIVMLLAVGVTAIKIMRDGQKKRFFFDRVRAAPFVNRWSRGEPIPISDIRVVFQAMQTFNAAVHDEI